MSDTISKEDAMEIAHKFLDFIGEPPRWPEEIIDWALIFDMPLRKPVACRVYLILAAKSYVVNELGLEEEDITLGVGAWFSHIEGISSDDGTEISESVAEFAQFIWEEM